MSSNTKIRTAIFDAYTERIDNIQLNTNNTIQHSFSDSFEKNMQKVLRKANYTYVTFFNRRMRLAAVACLIVIALFATTITTIAIVKPEIRKYIREQIDSWRYTFEQLHPDSVSSNIRTITPVVPKGFKKIFEFSDSNTYSIEYEKNDKFIHYDQYRAEGLGLHQTNTGVKETVMIKNLQADLYKEGNDYSMIWSDDIYVFYIYSNCAREDVIEIAKSIK